MKYIEISDIHLGHRNTPSTHVADNFRKYVLNDNNRDLDVIFIGGDFYDRQISKGTHDDIVCTILVIELLEYCHDNGIKLRLLRGTPGHEYEQMLTFVTLNGKLEKPADLKYFDTLDIDYMVEEDKYVLYIPDEWSNDHSLIERQIKERMDSLGISQVDIAILHSVFGYQMEGIPYKGFRYDEVYFLNLVKGYIHIGHVHKFSNFDRIIAGGGFDRFTHHEQGEKGYIRVDDGSWRFIENKNPFVYVTIKVTRNETLASLDKKMSKYDVLSFVRLSMDKDHPFNINFKELTIRYSQYRLTKLISDKKNKRIVDILDNDTIALEGFETLDKDVGTTLREIILNKYTLSESAIIRLEKHLELFKDSVYEEEK